MPLLVILKLLGGRIWAFLSHASFWQLAFGAALIFAGWERLQLSIEKRHSAKVEAQLVKAIDGREADRKAYAKAQADAAALNHAQVQKIQTKQEAITDAVKSDLQSRLERIRRELRAQSATPQSPAAGPGTGQASEAPCRASNSAWLCLSPEDRLRAAENEERHDQLINWSERQSEVH